MRLPRCTLIDYMTPTKPVAGPNAVPVLRQYLNDRPGKRYVAIVDDNTNEHCITPLITEVPELAGIDIIEVVNGEDSKDIEICASIWAAMVELKCDRNTLLFSVGGGMVCDLGGFVASCYKRGIEFIHIPTSLLAMVDASLGGKTGVNLDHLKNQIGLFSQPSGIYIDPRFLATLPNREYRAGLAEMAKHGLILDERHWNDVQNCDPSTPAGMEEAIIHSMAIKQMVVEEDLLEHGKRKILNFGHTIGHAVEALSMDHENPLLHGEAVALGLVAEAWLSHKVCGLPLEVAEDVSRWVHRIYPSLELPKVSMESILRVIEHDKKNSNGVVNYVLLEEVGKAVWDQQVPENLVAESLDFFSKGAPK